jgi:hypothetical protein
VDVKKKKKRDGGLNLSLLSYPNNTKIHTLKEKAVAETTCPG